MGIPDIKSSAEFLKIINDENKVTVIDFHAVWCGPCRMISPVLEKLSQEGEYKNLQYYKIDVDEVSEAAAEVGISAMPTFMVFKGGNKIGEVVGANPPALEDLLKAGLKAL